MYIHKVDILSSFRIFSDVSNLFLFLSRLNLLKNEKKNEIKK